jgi:7-cyano-7-deazaguanine synthase
MNSLSKEEFEKYRETWTSEWYDHWRLLDVDFEAYMLMKGLTKQEYKKINKMNKQAVLSLSGGMDSSTLLLRLLADGYEVTALSFDYGQKHNIELERAQSLVDYINGQFIVDEESKTVEYPYNVKYQVIKLDGLSQLLNSSLVSGGKDVPEGHYAEENMKATVVPNRNKIFSSIIQAVALSIAESKGTNCKIAMGIHAGDHAIYPDCRQEFRNADEFAFRMGNWGSEKVDYFTPYLEGDKFTILQDGEVLCDELGLDFNEVYKRTNTSYKPLYHELAYEDGTDVILIKEWFSDYKSASSVERVEAFIKLGRPDPVLYADEEGPVSWETARIYVEQVISEYEKEQLNIK